MPGHAHQLPDAFTLQQARKAGLSKREIYRRRDAGEFESIGHGLFRRSGTEPAQLDFIEIAARTPNATLCLQTALARYDLIDAIPAVIDVALPRGTRTPRTSKLAQWHHFDAATFAIEREQLSLTDELSIGIYSADRCIVDAFRMRGSAGRELGIEALKNWLKRKGARPARLVELAKQFPRAPSPLEAALEVLL
ncbi:MAG: type IV toxin-antitoxin system AbiEi family antitoxin domain-containing protein [Deltaproteobacteria bacterium]|nr:type IV toxin-antitoxin system AbiEi family antitoxin domain-containing protein [Deltaproteobacteria bacterium]